MSMVVQRFDKFNSWLAVIMWEHEFEKRDFYEPVENYDDEADKEVQQKLLELEAEWGDDLTYYAYDSVASQLGKGDSVPNAKTNTFSAWFPEPRTGGTEKPRRSDKTAKVSQKDYSHGGQSYKSKEITYVFRHYVNTALYIEQYRQEHTYSGMFRRERLDHRALSDSSLNRIQQRSLRLKPEMLPQPPPHIRFHTRPSNESTEFIELACQYKAASDVLKRPDDGAHLGGVSLMRLDKSPALGCSRPTSGCSEKGGAMLKCRGLQTVNLNIPGKVVPKAKSHKHRGNSATQNDRANCFSGKPMKPFPANGHCTIEELPP